MIAREGMQSELSSVTGAVKDHLAAVPDEVRGKKIEKQNWKTFETHAQRVGGKSTEESMAEIDRFIAQGKTDDGRAIEAAEKQGPSTRAGNELQQMLNRNGVKANISSYSVEGSSGTGIAAGKTKTITETTETRYEMEGERKEGVIAHNKIEFKNPGPGSADAFLNQYKAAEAAKYKPGYANRNPNGVN